MQIIEIAEGTITVEMQPEDAMCIARAFARMVELPFSGDADERLYQHYRAIFEASAVAGHAHYCIADDTELASASLSAIRGVKR